MIRLNVLFPNEEDKFDLDYYLNTHITLVKEHLGDLLQGIQVYRGKTDGGEGAAPFMIASCLFFQTIDDCHQAFTVHGEKLMADIANFTTLTPTIQIEEQLFSEIAA